MVSVMATTFVFTVVIVVANLIVDIMLLRPIHSPPHPGVQYVSEAITEQVEGQNEYQDH